MSIKNFIKKENKFEKSYFTTVVSNDDALHRGRLLVKIDAILGDIPFWVNATLVAGSTKLLLIPEKDDIVTVKFKNKDIYSGEWSLEGSPNDKSDIDPNKYGLLDTHGNCVMIDKLNKTIDMTILDGSINIMSNKKDNDEITTTAKVIVNSEGSILVESSNITMKAEKVSIDADVEISKTLKVIDECTLKGITWSTHKHHYTWTDGAGSGNTDPPQN